MYAFGTGKLYASPLSPTGTLTSPIEFGVLQDVSVDFKVDLKELYGSKRFPVAVADGKGKIDINAKEAFIGAQMFNLAFGGTTSNGGSLAQAVDEAHTVSGATIALANTAVITPMLPAVTAVVNGVLVQYVVQTSASPAVVAGYSCSFIAGVFNFAAGDNGTVVLVSYFYNSVRATSSTTTIANLPYGSATGFQLVMGNKTNNPNNNYSQTFALVFNRCISPAIKVDFKLDDWMIPDFTAQAFADANGNIGTVYLDQ